MRSTNVILALLSLSSTISALAAPKSSAIDVGLNLLGKDCQCSAMGSVCHKTSHINCCNGFSCEMMDNPNGDYGICRASDDRKKDEKCMSNNVCHPKSDINCCFGLYCDMTNNPNGDYGKCKPSKKSQNPLEKIADEEKCLESGSMHCNLLGAPPCCSGTKCNKVGRSDNNTFMCEKESGDDDKKQCLVLGAHHCNMSGMNCCPGASCKNIRGESFMCARDSDNDEDVSSTLSQNQQPLFSSKDKSVFREDCDRNMCIEGGQMCHHHRQNSKCPPVSCCLNFQCACIDSHRESFCVSMSDSNENIEITSSKKVAMSKEKKGGLMTETAHHKNPPGVHLLDVHAKNINMIAAAEVKDA